MQPICVLKAPSSLGECPVWSVMEQVLYWIDILKGFVHRFDPATAQNKTIELGQLVSSIGLCGKGKLVMSLRKGVALLDVETGKLEPIAEFEKDRVDNRFNDGKCDRQGNFWCTSMNQKEMSKDTAGLYRIGKDHSVSLKEDHVILGNG